MLRPEVLVSLLVLFILIWLIWKTYEKQIRRKLNMERGRPSIVTSTNICKQKSIGDQLFQLAAVLGVALDNNSAIALPEEIATTPLGRVIDLNLFIPQTYSPNLVIKEREEGWYTPIELPEDKRVYSLNGAFQAFGYIENIQNCRKYIKPQTTLLVKARERVPECTERNAIGVIMKESECSAIYYRTALTNIVGRLDEVSPIIVCSDNIPWCKRNLGEEFRDVIYILISTEDELDLAFGILVQCHHQVTSNSSFSWWISYFGRSSTSLGVFKEDYTTHHIVAPYPLHFQEYNEHTKERGHRDELYHPLWTILDWKGMPYTPKRISSLQTLAESRMRFSTFTINTGEKARQKQLLYGSIYVISPLITKNVENAASLLLTGLGMRPILYAAVGAHAVSQLGDREKLKELQLLSIHDRDLDTGTMITHALSHRSIWALELSKSTERTTNSSGVSCTIFEDGITTHYSEEELDKRVQNATQLMDNDWDILFLCRYFHNCELARITIEDLQRTYSSCCLHAYMLSITGMKKLLARSLYKKLETQVSIGIEKEAFKAYIL